MRSRSAAVYCRIKPYERVGLSAIRYGKKLGRTGQAGEEDMKEDLAGGSSGDDSYSDGYAVAGVDYAVHQSLDNDAALAIPDAIIRFDPIQEDPG